MSVQPGRRAKHLTAFLLGLGLLLALTLVLADQTATPTSGFGEGPEMRLLVTDPPDVCVEGVCQLATNESFKLGVEIVRAPAADSNGDPGYIIFQSSILYGSAITYDFSPTAISEILWPNCEPATALKSQTDQRLPGLGNNTDTLVSHGCLSGIIAPPPSSFVGIGVEIVLVCSPRDSSNPIEMLPYARFSSDASPTGTVGSLFRGPDNEDVVPKTTGLTMICGEPPTPTPGPTRTPGGPTDTVTPTPDLSTPTPSPTATPPPVTPTATFVSAILPCGDVNGDRRVNAEDALWVLWFSTTMIPSLPHPGDVNGDGVVDPLDALFILWIELNLFRCL